MDLPKLTKAESVYNVGDIFYEKAIKNVEGPTFNLYHGSYVRFGFAGLHWTGHEKIAQGIADHGNGKLLAKKFKKTDKFIYIDDGIEYNNLLYYMDELSRSGKSIDKYKKRVEALISAFLKLKKIKMKPMDFLLEASFRPLDVDEKKLCKAVYVPFIEMMKSLNARGFVYYNELEDKGDSFITFW